MLILLSLAVLQETLVPVFWEVLFPCLAFLDCTSKCYSYHLLPKTISLELLSSSMVVFFLPVKPSFPRARSEFSLTSSPD